MPRERRAIRALVKAVAHLGASLSSSPTPHPLPPADAQLNDPPKCEGAPQHPSPAHEAATPSVHHEEPVEATTGCDPDLQPFTPEVTSFMAIQTAATLVVQASDVFPALKGVSEGIQAIMKVHEAFCNDKEEFEQLALRVKLLYDIFCDRVTLPPEIEDRRDGLQRATEELGRQLREKTSQRELERVTSVREDQQDILQLIREIKFAIEFSLLDVVVTNKGMYLHAVYGIDWLKDKVFVEKPQKHIMQNDLRTIHCVAPLKKLDQLRKLGIVQGYGLSPEAPQCVPGSRILPIARLLAWAEDPSSHHVLWLTGATGTGKTTVSGTLCHQLMMRGLLGGIFFCSTKVQDLCDIHNIFPSLARMLADRYPEFGDALANILASDAVPLVHAMRLEQQYDLLIVQPAKIAFCNLDKDIILCADALDECRGRTALGVFLNTVLSKQGCHLKFFLTSRPDISAFRVLEAFSSSRSPLRFYDIDRDIARPDIKLYVNHELSRIPELQDMYGSCWPPPELERIVERADNHFIVAATLIRRINAGNPVARLMSYGSARMVNSWGVDKLYVEILQQAASGLRSSEMEDLRSCLSLLVVARRPLCVAEYAALLGQSVWGVMASFAPLHSVVETPSQRGIDPITASHASFVNFLTECHPTDIQPSSVSIESLLVDTRDAHFMVLERCMKLMESEDHGLYLGISGFSTSYRCNEQQKLPRLRSDLEYACTSWVHHALNAMPLPDGSQREIKTFLETKGVFWLEALSAERGIECSEILCDLSERVTIDGLATLLLNIRDFARIFTGPISYSSPHLYLSALPFHQATSNTLEGWLPSSKRPHNDAQKDWILVHRLHSGGVASLDLSRDGAVIVSGSYTGKIQRWDVKSGSAIGVQINGHARSVNSLALSPNGTRIVSGSDDKTVQVWDAGTGKAAFGALEGHSAVVSSVTFSPDGKRVASGSHDHTIRVWDAESGEPDLETLAGHTALVNTVAFSPDGSAIASGSDDRSVRLWDARKGRAAAAPLILMGHDDWVNCVAFAPDGRRIASGSDDCTVCVWQLQNGDKGFTKELEIKCRDRVKSVDFSPDGSTIVSGLSDGTIWIWNAGKGILVAGPIEGHANWVHSVCYTPDGSQVVSGSDDGTARVWHALNGIELPDLQSGVIRSVVVVAVVSSPDGTQFETTRESNVGTEPSVSGAECGNSECATSAAGLDGSACIPRSTDIAGRVWDVQSGSLKLGLLCRPSESVTYLTFSTSSNISSITSGSQSIPIRARNAPKGQSMCTGHSTEEHSECATSLSFSRDGSRMVSASGDHKIQVWDMESGPAILRCMEGHTDLVTCVVFSSDGSRALSGSRDKTIRVWDVESGETVLGPMKGHLSGITYVSFSPDGTTIASGSYDGTLRLWDAQSGKPVLGPVRGHAGAISSISFSPDGSTIVSTSAERRRRILVAGGGQGRKNLMHENPDMAITFTFHPNGSRTVSGPNGTVMPVWDEQLMPCQQCPSSALLMDESGWIRSAFGDLILWVPPQYRPTWNLKRMSSSA